MPILLARFDAIMAYALHAAGNSAQALSWESLAAELDALLEQERRLPPPPGFSGAELEECRFAVYAWTDETLLNSGRADALLWMSGSLQQRFFRTSNAGVEFYERLDALLEEPPGEPDTLQLSEAGTPGRSVPAIPRPAGAGLLTSLPSRLALWKTRQERTDHLDIRNRAQIIRVYAACLLYGFRGGLCRPEQEELRRDILSVCVDLAAPDNIWPLPLRELSDVPAGKKAPLAWKTIFLRLEPALHLLVPALVCLGFYVYCANIIAGISLPGASAL